MMLVILSLISFHELAGAVKLISKIQDHHLPPNIDAILDLVHRDEHGHMLEIMESQSIKEPEHLNMSFARWGGNGDLRRVSQELLEVGGKIAKSGHLQALMPQIDFKPMLRAMQLPFPQLAFAPSPSRDALLSAAGDRFLGYFDDSSQYKYGHTAAFKFGARQKFELPDGKGVIAIGLSIRTLTINLPFDKQITWRKAMEKFFELKSGVMEIIAGVGVVIVKTKVELCPATSFRQEIGWLTSGTDPTKEDWEFASQISYGGCFIPVMTRGAALGNAKSIYFTAQVCGGQKHTLNPPRKGRYVKLTIKREAEEGTPTLKTADGFVYSFKGKKNETTNETKDDWTLDSFGLYKKWVPDKNNKCSPEAWVERKWAEFLNPGTQADKEKQTREAAKEKKEKEASRIQNEKTDDALRTWWKTKMEKVPVDAE